MEKNSFFKKNTIIKTNLRTSRTLIIVFATFWFLVALASLIMIATLGAKVYTISNSAVATVNVEGKNINGHTTYQFSISALFLFLLGAPTIMFSMILTIVFSNLIFINEIKTGQISIWMTSQNSKAYIFFSKLVLLWIIQIFIFIPSFILIIIFSAFANDAKINIGYVFADIANMIVMLVFVTAFVTMIGVAFSNDPKTGTTINSMIIVYMLVVYCLIWVGQFNAENKNLSWMVYFKYASIQSLFAQSAHFKSSSQIDVEYTESGLFVYLAERKGAPMWWAGVAPVINFGLACGFTYLGYKTFKSKELNI